MNTLLKNTYLLSLLIITMVASNSVQAKWINDMKGCRVWVDGKVSNKPIRWSGQCKNGFASGKGKVDYNLVGTDVWKSCHATFVQGKMEGYTKCIMNNGDTISGKMKKSKYIGKVVYIWKKPACTPHCIKKYEGTIYNDNMAVGTITLTNGNKRVTKYHPDTKGCLIWNEKPIAGEKIIWSGQCKNGYGSGKGVLKFYSAKAKQLIHCNLVAGRIDGYATQEISYANDCNTCVVHLEGEYKSGYLIKGVSTLANGKKVQSNAALENATVDVIGTQHMHWMFNNVDLGLY